MTGRLAFGTVGTDGDPGPRPRSGRPAPRDREPADRAPAERVPAPRVAAASVDARRAGGARGRGEPRSAGAPLVLAAAVTTGWAVLVSATPVLLAVAGVLLISPEPHRHRGRAAYRVRGLVAGARRPLDDRTRADRRWCRSRSARWRRGGWRAPASTPRGRPARGAARSVAPALRAGAAVAVAYGLYGTVLALGVSTSGLRVSAPRAA